MANSFQGVLAGIPGLGGYLAGEQNDQQLQMGQLQQVGALQGILAQKQKQQQMQMALQEEAQIKGVLSQTGGDPAKAITALVSTGHPRAIDMAAKLKAMIAKPDGQSIGSGGLRLPDGTIIPPAARPNSDEGTWSEPYHLGGATVQKNSKTGQVRTAVTREPQVKVTQEAPVTPVTIQDPNDPSSTIVIDGRTRKVLGKGPKMTEAGKIDAKTSLQMTGLGADLQTAEDLLTGVVRTSDGQVIKGNLPTGSGIGAAYDAAAGLFGASPSGAAEADSLKTVAARLIGRTPRFEGPQSDKDVQLYKQAAGDSGNEKLPRERRLAAIRTMRQIYAGYESGARGRLIGNRRASDNAPQPKVVDFNSLPE